MIISIIYSPTASHLPGLVLVHACMHLYRPQTVSVTAITATALVTALIAPMPNSFVLSESRASEIRGELSGSID